MSYTTTTISFDLKRCNCKVTIELYNYAAIKETSAFVDVRSLCINPMTGEEKSYYVDHKHINFYNADFEARRHEILQAIVDSCSGYLSITMKQRLLKKICDVITK